ncbi:protein Wnt-8b isoform X1 [Pelobates fuscus]|uniref:protein Wnt-8b isoform X1 n=2 Tax=Pelobates fuscus TaxID=191477 RepID=UPI002FE42E14
MPNFSICNPLECPRVFQFWIMLNIGPHLRILLILPVLQFSQSWSMNNFLMTGPKAYLIYSSSVAAGAQSGIEECKYQFAWDRWNCPERTLQLSSHSGLRSDLNYQSTGPSTAGSSLFDTGPTYPVWSINFNRILFSRLESQINRTFPSRSQIPLSPNYPLQSGTTLSTGLISPANRETAFVHAISSAGVMYTLTRNCSLGDFDNCGCDDSRNGQLGGQGWLWGGCSDNVGFGEAISKQFVDALETGQDARAAMNLHNNEAGRKAVQNTMKQTCKCHGVSGSCTTQTCWLQLPEFREVGYYLKEKYHKALKVDLLQGVGNSAASRGAIAEIFNSISKKELVHLEDSPDYCLENKTLGLLGTKGRECLKRGKMLNKWEKRSCRRLCGDCGLAVEKRRADMVSSCNCKFHWCCAVKCEQCRKSVTKYFCVKKEKRERSGGGITRKKEAKLKKKI